MTTKYETLCKPQEGDPAWLKVALGELGVKETYGPASTPRVQQYMSHTGLGKDASDDLAWCSCFANFCMDVGLGGKAGTGSAAARSWLTWGEELVTPRRGCVAVFTRPGGAAWQGHVGFWMATEGGTVLVCGGNQGNAVCVSPYSRSRLLGYRWVRTLVDPGASGQNRPVAKRKKAA